MTLLQRVHTLVGDGWAEWFQSEDSDDDGFKKKNRFQDDKQQHVMQLQCSIMSLSSNA